MSSLSSERPMQTYTYHSLGQRYNGNKTPDLLLTLCEYGQDSIEIELINVKYPMQKWQEIKHVFTFVIIYVVYSISTSESCSLLNGHILWDVIFFVLSLYRLFKLFSLIQTEKVLFCLDLALQCHTLRSFGRTSNLFIPANNIYDFVINEVIENLDVHYILIIRTKGDLLHKKPVITLFNNLRPSLECLETIYKCLDKRVRSGSTLS